MINRLRPYVYCSAIPEIKSDHVLTVYWDSNTSARGTERSVRAVQARPLPYQVPFANLESQPLNP